MTTDDRARLIERMETICEQGYGLWLPAMKEALSDLRRLDVLEKALRKLVEAISIEGESNHYDTVINNCFTEAKQALGDA